MSESKSDVAVYQPGSVVQDESKGHNQKDTFSSSRLTRTFYIATGCFAITTGAMIGVYDLQSSINISMGLGITTMLVMSGFSFASTLLLIPFLLDFHGPKITLILCQLAASIYALANLYPRWFTFLPAAVLVGLTEGGQWAAISTITNFVGKNLAEKDTEADKTANVSRYYGILGFIFSLGQLVGSGISFAVLNGLKNTNETELYDEWDNISLISLEELDWSMCVSNDCQSNYIYNMTEEQKDSFGADQYALNIVMGIFAAMCLGGATLTWSHLPRIPARYDKSMGSNRPSVRFAIGEEIRKTFLHFISFQHLLILPTNFYFGTNIVYSLSDFNRAYISCTIGVEWIGLFTAINGIASMVASALVSFFSPKTGRIPIYLTAVTVDAVFFLTGLFWEPTASNIYMLYFLSSINGLTNGLWLTVSSIVTSALFADCSEIAFSTQMLSVSVGAFVAHSWSIPLCVYQKIYINLSVIALATLCWSIAEVRHRRSLKKETKILEKEQQMELANRIL